MPTELIKDLLEAGVHFGHQTKRWNPKMKRFIFGHKSGIYIIDLEKTVACLETVKVFLKDIVKREDDIIFVGTKKQAKDIIKEESERCGVFYVNERWIGGLLTNFATVSKRIERLKEIKRMEQEGELQKFTKKEVSRIIKEKLRLQQNFEGVENIHRLPKAIFIVDSNKEENAVREAKKLSIPIIALIDTNCDPDEVDFPIPGNDDAMKSIKLITSTISSYILEGKNEAGVEVPLQPQKEELTQEPGLKSILTKTDQEKAVDNDLEAKAKSKKNKKDKDLSKE